jgi:hypothetical protein
MIRWIALVLCLIAGPATAESVLTLTPRVGTSIKVLVDNPAQPRGSVILLVGGLGVLNLDASGKINTDLAGNHLARTRGQYVRAGWAVFMPDIAEDQKGTNMYRFAAAHAIDLAAVVEEARKLGGPVAIVATSRGAVSAATFFTRQTVTVDALVISSGVLMGNDRAGSASTTGDLSRVRVPVMLLRHSADACRATPPGDADRFKALLVGAPKVDIVTLSGGAPRGPTADPCGAAHYHGFFGIDDEAVAATVNWLAANARK